MVSTHSQGSALDSFVITLHFLKRLEHLLNIGASELQPFLVTGLLVSQIIFIYAIKKND